jgi:sigma-B regulation protein RsbU (phosphoserine phosphatase)
MLALLRPLAAHTIESSLIVDNASRELAERYEEINLLYTISEILGRTVSLQETAATILRELSETVGARRGAILVHERATDTLQVVAQLGGDGDPPVPISVSDETSASARAFRDRHGRIVDENDALCAAEAPYRRGAMLSVPIMWTTPGGGEPLGVVNLSGRRSGQAWSAGDQKLVAAIATQIGTAIQNARLVRASLQQQQLAQEMQLAHDLQMKLLPSAAAVAPDADVAARVIPAESVGGDFYHLFRLGDGRIGAMIADVSSHGYRAALIMALAMSAAAIHAQTTGDPGETLNALLATLRDELESTEMFITVCYAVVDARRGTLRYANAGHPHAFVVHGNGAVERLPALDPPLGMSPDVPKAATRGWALGQDILVLFTDGVSDARNRRGTRLGEQRVLDTIAAHRHETSETILTRVFDLLAAHTGGAARRDDLALVVLRS